MERILCLAIGYAFGLIQTGYFYGKVHGVDIRKHGSGNSGTTNALRVLGAKAGLIVFAGDFLKTFVPCVLVRIFLGDGALYSHVLVLYTGLGVTLGHNYPFYLGFKGGKGIAAMAGILMASDWRITLICAAVFIGTVAITRYVSLGSLLVAAIFLAMTAYFTFTGGYGTAVLHDVSGMTSLNTPYLRWECVTVAFVIAAMAFWRHRANIKRLLHGTENKLGAKKS
ncbi:MAG: glycerol-3-phosphate 1-O-acyltransferase PlsY [Lachnospiraceae bacterium]